MADELDAALTGLEPRILWEQFDAIRRIPRPSLHEERVRQYLRDLAAAQGWRTREDKAGNIVIYVQGCGRGVDSASLAFQGHMDMVCVKDPEVTHDFHRDPIALARETIVVEGEPRDVLTAQGTTLGSDNGLGIAAALAVALDESVDHPPLELLFTADEETGMTGAFALDGSMISAGRLINLDAEEQGSVYLSCAGGRDLVAQWELQREPARAEDIALRVRVSGLRGGHSGVDIHEGRPNAIMVLLRALAAPNVELDGVRLASCDGGGRTNAIPRTAQAILWCSPQRSESLRQQLIAAVHGLIEGFGPLDRELTFLVEQVDASECPGPLAAAGSRAVLKALTTLPDGVIAWSKSIDGLVETSSNLGILETTEGTLRATCMTRSSADDAIEHVQERMKLALEASGAQVEFRGAYPGWEADLDNPLLERHNQVYERLFGRPPAVKAIHAGLECGILHKRIPGVHMIAFGPEIRNAHTPDEAVLLDTVEPFWRLVAALASDLCD